MITTRPTNIFYAVSDSGSFHEHATELEGQAFVPPDCYGSASNDVKATSVVDAFADADADDVGERRHGSGQLDSGYRTILAMICERTRPTSEDADEILEGPRAVTRDEKFDHCWALLAHGWAIQKKDIPNLKDEEIYRLLGDVLDLRTKIVIARRIFPEVLFADRNQLLKDLDSIYELAKAEIEVRLDRDTIQLGQLMTIANQKSPILDLAPAHLRTSPACREELWREQIERAFFAPYGDYVRVHNKNANPDSYEFMLFHQSLGYFFRTDIEEE